MASSSKVAGFDYQSLIEILHSNGGGVDGIYGDGSQNEKQELKKIKGLQRWAEQLPDMLQANMSVQRYGDIPRWQQAYSELPSINTDHKNLASDWVQVGLEHDCSSKILLELESVLRKFQPWRKGPFNLFGVAIDTEWRSDFKWQRLQQVVEPLKNRRVLDVGCGSGYHCWRMAGEGAKLVVGIDPTPLFVFQYWVLQKYITDSRVWVVPQRMEQLPEKMRSFDSVFSMGILYHRRSPFDHLQELRDALRPGGQLILETLVVDEEYGDCLVPEGRYSKMGNVWFIPSCSLLESWLRKMKFTNIKLVDVSQTTAEEQRRTDWMTFESLTDFLDPADTSKTIEGYPAPRRAIFTATAI